MADNAITLQGLSAITRFIGHSTFQTQDQNKVLGWFVITTNHPLKSWAVWLFPGTSFEKDSPRVCPLERDERWLCRFIRSLVMDGTCTATTLQRLPHSSFEGSQLWRSLMECCFGTFLRSNDEAFGLVLTFDFHAHRWEIVRKVMTLNRLAANFSEPSQGGFFDVLTARNSLEKNHEPGT